ncbi:MAG: starch-binding protein [Oscillospiraceae bacterium]|nr:starch-binding protein [Oscillospiraceae bacterium]
MLKRLLSLIVSIFMLAAVAAPVAFAAEGEMIVAYISVPEDWENPCVWAWDDDGNGAFDAWPGDEAEKDPANDGWYYIYLPSWVTNVIINANDGSVQTGDFPIEGKNAWIAVESPEAWDVSYDAKTTGEAPAYVKKITVYARVPQSWEAVNLWAWLHPDGTNAFDSWPGESMKANDKGWFTARVPAWINSVIVNGGTEGVQTGDLTVEPKDMYIIVANDLSAEVAYENPDLAGDNITVHVKVPDDWANPHLWAWLDPDGTNAFATWPGEPLQDGGEWYSLSVPGWINSVIVNANEGGVQTGDTKDLETGKDIWILVSGPEDYVVAYEEITEAPVADDAPDVVEPAPAPAETPGPAPVSQSNSGSPARWIIATVTAVAAAVGIGIAVKKKK